MKEILKDPLVKPQQNSSHVFVCDVYWHMWPIHLIIDSFSPQTGSTGPREKPQSTKLSTTKISTASSNGSSASQSFSPSSVTLYPADSSFSRNKNTPSPPVISTSPLSSPKIRRDSHSTLPHVASDSLLYRHHSPNQSPKTQRRNSPSRINKSPRGSSSYKDKSPCLSPTTVTVDQSPWSPSFHLSSNFLSPFDSGQTGRRSPRPDRSPSPLSINRPLSNTLPLNFGYRQPGKWL